MKLLADFTYRGVRVVVEGHEWTDDIHNELAALLQSIDRELR